MHSLHQLLVIPAVLAAWALVGTGPPDLQDAESTTHDFEAARYQVVDAYEYPGFEIVQIELPVLSHFSYLLGSDDECLVVDPGRDIAIYLAESAKRGWAIQGVYLTHSHADFVAGHTELARQLEVPIYISKQAGAEFEHQAIQEEETVVIGQAILRFFETPGHTPDGTCGVASSSETPDKPLALFSGDTLFIGSVGRPDLLGEGMAASTLASMMYDTWNDKLAKLPDTVRVLPAHGAGSLCGAHLSDEPTSTLGEQRIANPYLQYKDRGQFVARLLEGLPEAPQYFQHNASLNRIGPEPAQSIEAGLPWIEPTERLTDSATHFVVDIRDAAAYAAGHIPNSVNIGIRGRFETWLGVMVPWDADLVVIGETEQELAEALRRMQRVGYQAQCLRFDAWTTAGMEVATNAMIEPQALHEAMGTQDSPVIVDVRLPAEWMALRVGATVNLPLNHLAEDAKLLDRDQAIVTVCNSAFRSSMAVGVLQRQGFTNVSNLEGGGKAWISAGLPVHQAKTVVATSTPTKRAIRLGERVSSAELNRLIMDMPETFELIDIRPTEHFADYHLPRAVNVDLADALNNPAYLTGVGPLVIVDRDGSVALMVAGVLSQKTERAIKVLYGGMQAYWAESDYGAFAKPLPSDGFAPTPPLSPLDTKRPEHPASPSPKRSAGC